MRLFVGIDVSSKDIKACPMENEGHQLDTFSVDNDLIGASTLRDRVVALADKLQSESI